MLTMPNDASMERIMDSMEMMLKAQARIYMQIGRAHV